MDEELKKLLEKANENYLTVKGQVEAGETKLTEAMEAQKALVEKLEALEGGFVSKADYEELKNELADLEVKVKSSITPEYVKIDKEDLAIATKSAIGRFFRENAGTADAKKDQAQKMKDFVVSEVKAALNLTTTQQGLESIDEVLSRDIIERAREAYPIIGSIGRRNMPRSLREEVLTSYPSVQQGIENVAGADISETDVQRYAEVVNQISKVNAKPRITDEAMSGSDLDLYGHLLSLLDDEIGRWLALQILFGDGTSKNMRGILSSSRLDITNTTGESWKPTIHASDPRPADMFPALSTGIAGGMPVADVDKVDLLIDVTEALPTKYHAKAKWYFNRKFRKLVKKVRDGDQTPIYMNDFMQGSGVGLHGYPVVIEDYMPNYDVADAPFLIFGDLEAAFKISNGDIDKMLLDPYTVDGCTVVKIDKEYFEIVGKNDAIVVLVATTNSG